MTLLDRIEVLVQSDLEITVGRPVNLGRMKQASQVLGMSIRGPYLDFVCRFGWMNARGTIVNGFGIFVPPEADAVEQTLFERTAVTPALRTDLLLISYIGNGDSYCLDFGRGRLEAPVVLWQHEEPQDQEVPVVAPDFCCWLEWILARSASTSLV